MPLVAGAGPPQEGLPVFAGKWLIWSGIVDPPPPFDAAPWRRCRASFQLPGGGMRHGVRLERRAVSDRIQEAIEERVEAVTDS